jgi:hypothetical protein
LVVCREVDRFDDAIVVTYFRLVEGHVVKGRCGSVGSLGREGKGREVLEYVVKHDSRQSCQGVIL